MAAEQPLRPQNKTVRVVVVGAGVIGLSTALRILQESAKTWRGPTVAVTVIADIFSPHTTSDGSGGFWEPYILNDTPLPKTRKWSKETWDHLLHLGTTPTAQEVGAQLVSGYTLHSHVVPEEPFWKDIVLGFRELTQEEYKMFPYASWGSFHTSTEILLPKYLPWLMTRFKDLGGKVEFGTVQRLEDLADRFDVIVNCCGPRAGQLVGDKKTMPVRGQILRVHAPWVKHFYLVETPAGLETYIFPLGDFVVVGGVAQEGNSSEIVDPADSEAIWNRAVKYVPNLKNARVLSEWAGLRPGRTEVRLEAETLNVGGKVLKVIHNYGHGGAGITLHWGCAADATALVKKAVESLATQQSSKL